MNYKKLIFATSIYVIMSLDAQEDDQINKQLNEQVDGQVDGQVNKQPKNQSNKDEQSKDEKTTIDDHTQITIQSQELVFYTTYATIKKIPYLESLYSRWTADRSKIFIVDIPTNIMREILAECTIVTREFLGLVEPECKAKLIQLDDVFDEKYLTIYVSSKQIIFKYKDKSQTWTKEDDGRYKFGFKNESWSINPCDYTLRSLMAGFKKNKFEMFMRSPPIVDAVTYEYPNDV